MMYFIIKNILTAYITPIISNFPLIIHLALFLWMIKDNIADWMAANSDKMAVLEYWYGYFLLILVCIRNHEDQKRQPAVRNIEPMIHFFNLEADGVVVALSSMCWDCGLIKGIPLKRINNKVPPIHTKVPSSLAFVLLLFMLTFSILKISNQRVIIIVGSI